MEATNDDSERHDRQVAVIRDAIVKLLVRFGPLGITPEAIFEGAIRGASIQLIAARGLTAEEVANLLRDMATGFENLDKPNLRIVT